MSSDVEKSYGVVKKCGGSVSEWTLSGSNLKHFIALRDYCESRGRKKVWHCSVSYYANLNGKNVTYHGGSGTSTIEF